MKDAQIIASNSRVRLSPRNMLSTIFKHRHLINQMSKREILSRYKGSSLGILWSVITPMVMLVIYTFIFSVVFKAKWNTGGDESRYEFAVILFAGLLTHTCLAEVLIKSPSLIIGNVNYVKKVVFPLEILPVINVLCSIFNTSVSIIVLLAALLIVKHDIPLTAIQLPLVLMPLMILATGLSWFLASLGVYIRDIGQSITILTTILSFLSPIFYPVSAVPEVLRSWLMLNPLTFIIEQVRNVMIWGVAPNYQGLCLYTVCAALVAWLGFVWFQKTRKGFADVL